jgi:cytochrome c-type biogenesis protein CcmH/NrfF
VTRWVALAGAVLLVGAAVAMMLLLQRPSAATPAEQAARLAAELRCPDCESLSVAESRTASATAIRQEIASQLAAGRTPDQIRESFVARYGEWILLEPRGAPLWLVAPLAIVAGGGLLAWWLIGRRRTPAPDASQPLSDAERARLASELERLDG